MNFIYFKISTSITLSFIQNFVFIYSFIKGANYNEYKIIRNMKNYIKLIT